MQLYKNNINVHFMIHHEVYCKIMITNVTLFNSY